MSYQNINVVGWSCGNLILEQLNFDYKLQYDSCVSIWFNDKFACWSHPTCRGSWVFNYKFDDYYCLYRPSEDDEVIDVYGRFSMPYNLNFIFIESKLRELFIQLLDKTIIL